MKIELLYFDGCPSWENGLKELEIVLQKEGIADSVNLVKIKDDDDAAHLKFLGSPSFRVNDVELWPEERETYSLSCRVYSTADGIKGWPTVEMLREKIHSMMENTR